MILGFRGDGKLGFLWDCCWQRLRYALMLIWLLMMGTAPAMLAPLEPSLTHTIAAQPVAFILLALGVALVWGWLDRRQPVLGLALAVGLVRWFNPAGGWVWLKNDTPVTYYFPTDPLGVQQYEPLLQQIFLADAEPIATDGDDFQAYRVTNPTVFEAKWRQAVAETAVSWPPDLDYLPKTAVPVNFDDRMALQGVEILETAVQVGEPLRFITYWQVLKYVPTPLVAFAHLTDDGVEIWGQQDWLDVRAEVLQPGDRFVQLHQLQLNPETPPGKYHIQLGLYGPDTLVRLPVKLEGSADSPNRVWVG